MTNSIFFFTDESRALLGGTGRGRVGRAQGNQDNEIAQLNGQAGSIAGTVANMC